MRPQLDAIVRAAVARELTVAELNAVTRSLPPEERSSVLTAIRRASWANVSRLTLVPKRKPVPVTE
jgi:hypothetical protein